METAWGFPQKDSRREGWCHSPAVSQGGGRLMRWGCMESCAGSQGAGRSNVCMILMLLDVVYTPWSSDVRS